MRVLLSTIGSRGDVQPLVSLALTLRDLGHAARFCVPPDFKLSIEGLGFDVRPIGPELRSFATAKPQASLPTPEERRQLMADMLDVQFRTIAASADGCDCIVGATALQMATPSIAESLSVPYVFVAFTPAVLPSRHHAPPVLNPAMAATASPISDYSEVWARDAHGWNDWAPFLNAQRASLNLPPVTDVRTYVMTEHPWLAADPVLAPWPEPRDGAVFQVGAMLNEDERPLPSELEAFLSAGEPPVYFGFGSTFAAEGLSAIMIASARLLGRRAILSRGWTGLSTIDDRPDCLAIDEVNLQTLFPRVAAVVHHGGAGTATIAAQAGVPQVVIPQIYDQYYWARRIGELGIGIAHAPGMPSIDSLASALQLALEPEISTRARFLADSVRADGAMNGATVIAGIG